MYKYGLGWVLLSIQLPAVWLSLGVLGKKFAILAQRYNAVTLNDMLLARFGVPLLVWLASVSLLVAFLLVAFIGAMTVQFVGGARLLAFLAGNRFGRSAPPRFIVMTRTAMPWIQLKITTTDQLADTLSAALTESGAVSVTFEDTHDSPVYEPLQCETRLWGDTDVIPGPV